MSFYEIPTLEYKCGVYNSALISCECPAKKYYDGPCKHMKYLRSKVLNDNNNKIESPPASDLPTPSFLVKNVSPLADLEVDHIIDDDTDNVKIETVLLTTFENCKIVDPHSSIISTDIVADSINEDCSIYTITTKYIMRTKK